MNIVSVATAWGSRYGGVNVFNYRLCCALANMGHNITAYVKQYSVPDLADATPKHVALKHINRPSEQKWTQEDVGYIDYDLLGSADIIIVHDIIGKAVIDSFPKTMKRPVVAAFIHTLYRDTDYFGDMSDDNRKRRTDAQLSLIQTSDVAFTSGEWIAEQILEDYPYFKDKIKPFTPGRLETSPPGANEHGPITTFGRLSLEYNDKKRASSVLDAYMKLANAAVREGGAAVPNLRFLGVNCNVAVQQELKQEIYEVAAWSGRLEFLDFNPYYQFETSEVVKTVGDSKIILTPSIVESFGLTSLEAIALGIPLIASRRSGFSYELKKLIRPIPEFAIEWLEYGDFDDLSSALQHTLKHVLRRYPSYKAGAMVLAENIATSWPTWDQSCQQALAHLSSVQRSRPPIQAPTSQTSQSAEGPFSILKGLKLPSPIGDNLVAPEEAQVPERSSLERFADLTYGRNLVAGGIIANIVRRRYRGRVCTELQQQVVDLLSPQPPHNYQDILLCGGTSSGKTTAAELLFGLANNSDFTTARILYLAPTRALAQERARDWSQTFKALTIPRCDDNVIISTGEDHSSDRALARGEFLIACLVFEKANVILSASPELMNRLTMVVVDELHMIADIHRGPIIETLLAKIKYEKRRRQKREDLQVPLRIVGVTTERATAESFENYFTNIDVDSDQLLLPLKAVNVGRPRPVRHVLVEPESTGQKAYTETEIAMFDTDAPLRLTLDQLEEFAARLIAYSRTNDMTIYRGGRGKKLKHSDKHLYFIKEWLFNNKYGKRLLVFIGSKMDQVTLADRLQSEVKKTPTLVDRELNIVRLNAVVEKIKIDDTSVSVETLNRAIGKGIFIHNADISRALRQSMEDYLQIPLPAGAASEVVIATETLSYGVNLSIDDVALLSLEFPASERNQEYGATPKILSRCAFSNMCGRAGRLNQKNEEAVVYVWPITNHEYSAKRLVEIFYVEEDKLSSKIMHGDDKEAYERVKKSDDRTAQAPLLYTYPFVKTFLDGLRFTGGAPGLNGATRRNDASLEELEEEFTNHLLYWQENSENATNRNRLNASVRNIIEGSMQPNLELVKKSGRGYKITKLGSSIIDTGTEISTLEPLKKALEKLLTLLRTEIAPDDIPVEVLLLPIVVQNEAHRQVLFGMPEFRAEVARDDNRTAMLKWVAEEGEGFGFTQNIVGKMAEFLAYCDGEPRHAPSGDTATELVHDGCLRLFCGLLLWVSGESIATIHRKLKAIGRVGGNPGDINTNFATFADRISWKLMFLSDLMRFVSSPVDTRMLQTKARRLNIRLRLGCAENALPFLAKDGNRTTVISRQMAHELLKAGATPKTISSGEFDLDSYPPVQQSQIKTQVRSYIRSSFHQLKNEFVYSAANDAADSICRGYWEFADTVIKRSTENDRHMPSWPTRTNEEISVPAQAAHSRTQADSPLVTMREEDDAFVIIGHKARWEDDTRVPTEAVKWYVQISHGANSIHEPPSGYINVIVDFPWLLQSVPSENKVLRISPAAFGILLTLLARSFFKDSVIAIEILTGCETSISSLTLIDKLYSELALNQLPEPIFDAWAGYWDAE